MCDLKSQIFALLKKCPNNISFNSATYYKDDNTTYVVSLHQFTKSDTYEYVVNLDIYSGWIALNKHISVTEKEYMDLKWTIEDWDSVLKNKTFAEFKEFTESEPNSMDDLLND